MDDKPVISKAMMVAAVLTARRRKRGRDADRNIPTEVRKNFVDDDERMAAAVAKRVRRERRNLLNSGMPVTYGPDPWE